MIILMEDVYFRFIQLPGFHFFPIDSERYLYKVHSNLIFFTHLIITENLYFNCIVFFYFFVNIN